MKKVFFVAMEKDREVSLKKLRELGLIHIERKSVSSDELVRLFKRKEMISQAKAILQRYSSAENAVEPSNVRIPPDLPEYILRLAHEKEVLLGDLELLLPERRRIEEWGDFDPLTFTFLASQGIMLFLYKLPLMVYKRVRPETKFIILSKDKRWVRAVTLDEQIQGMPPIALPGQSLSDLDGQIKTVNERIGEIETILTNLESQKEALEAKNSEVLEEIEYETAKAKMDSLEEAPEEIRVSWLSGYIPSEKIDQMKQAAVEYGLALKWVDPTPADKPPTILKNKPAVQIIQPLFSMLGTLPSYWEYDISLSYLVFMCIFFSMILGDAVYGMVILTIGISIGLALKKKSGVFPAAPKLIILLSSCTIVWGALTGSWFGTPIADLPHFLRMLILPAFNDAGPLTEFPLFLKKIFHLPETVPMDNLKTQWNVQFLCFTVGMCQLVWARGKNIFKALPSLVAFAQAGWLIIMVGIYFLVLFILLKVPLPSFVTWLIAAGVALNFIFSEQRGGNFLKNIGKSFANVFSIVLKTIGCFADIISYIRLFAVGMAGSIIIQTINSMAIPADGFGSFGLNFLLRLLGTAVVLMLGHSLHLAMNALSVIVHGLRLNLLEYAGNHLGMEWSGYEYSPFASKQKKQC